jgi:hypothetical protein
MPVGLFMTGPLCPNEFRVPSKGAIPPGSPHRAAIERDAPLPEASFTCLSKSPVKEPPSKFPQRGPYGERCLFPEPSFTYLQSPQQRSPPSKFPSQSSHRQRCSISRAFFYLSLKVPGEGALPAGFSDGTPMERCPFPEPSFSHLFTQRSPWTSAGAIRPRIQSSLDMKNSRIKWLQIIFKLHGVTSILKTD